MLLNPSLARSLELHESAVAALLLSAESVPESRWHEAIGEGKWSPAVIVAHLNCTYDTLLRELERDAGR